MNYFVFVVLFSLSFLYYSRSRQPLNSTVFLYFGWFLGWPIMLDKSSNWLILLKLYLNVPDTLDSPSYDISDKKFFLDFIFKFSQFFFSIPTCTELLSYLGLHLKSKAKLLLLLVLFVLPVNILWLFEPILLIVDNIYFWEVLPFSWRVRET